MERERGAAGRGDCGRGDGRYLSLYMYSFYLINLCAPYKKRKKKSIFANRCNCTS